MAQLAELVSLERTQWIRRNAHETVENFITETNCKAQNHPTCHWTVLTLIEQASDETGLYPTEVLDYMREHHLDIGYKNEEIPGTIAEEGLALFTEFAHNTVPDDDYWTAEKLNDDDVIDKWFGEAMEDLSLIHI